MRALPTAAVLLASIVVTPAETREPSGPKPSPSNEPVEAELAALVQQLVELRELPLKKPVQFERMSAFRAREAMAEQLERDLSDEEAELQAQLLSGLGLIPDDYPLKQALLDVIEEQLAGFYDPEKEQLVLVHAAAGSPAEQAGLNQALMRRLTLIHELAHALADQHFDLENMLHEPVEKRRDDQLLARRALAEGDATFVSLLDMLESQGLPISPETFPDAAMLRSMGSSSIDSGLFPAYEDAPEFIRSLLAEPYLLGLMLVVDTWREGGWPAVNALWRSPPASSEQLLHPERRSDQPVAVSLSEMVSEPWKLATSSELGELGIKMWLALELDEQTAARAAEGWDGDRAGMLVSMAPDAESDETLARERIVWHSVWDDADEATEFSQAAEDWLRKAGDRVLSWLIAQRGARIELSVEPRRAEIVTVPEDPWEGVEVKGSSP
ncbi:MAG: hypothetical protein JSV80_02210 [Acidobacteriota bacterium]|nr:MAG: hypothetical protein JSV80_02210 [Acidobacteriota bacterium]